MKLRLRQRQRTDPSGGILLHSVVTLVLIGMAFLLGYMIGKQRGRLEHKLARPQSVEDILRRELSEKEDSALGKREYEFYEKLTKQAPEESPKATVAAPAEKQAAKGTTAKPASPDRAFSYTLQVGSFRSQESAKQLQSELARQQVVAKIRQVDLKEKGSWWRVQVGSFAAKSAAQKAADDLKQKTGKSCLITRLDLLK